MKRPSPLELSRRTWAALLLGLLALALPLAWWLQQPVRDFLLPPLTAWFWRLQNLGRMMPQADLWVGLVVLGGVNAALFLARRARLNSPRPPVPPRQGRVGHWLGTLRVGRRARRLLIWPLRALFVQIVAHGEHQPRDVVLARLQGELLPIPPHLQAYLNDRRFKQSPARVDAGSSTYLPYGPELEEIVRILEDYLEVPHES